MTVEFLIARAHIMNWRVYRFLACPSLNSFYYLMIYSTVLNRNHWKLFQKLEFASQSINAIPICNSPGRQIRSFLHRCDQVNDLNFVIMSWGHHLFRKSIQKNIFKRKIESLAIYTILHLEIFFFLLEPWPSTRSSRLC